MLFTTNNVLKSKVIKIKNLQTYFDISSMSQGAGASCGSAFSRVPVSSIVDLAAGM